MTTYYRTVEVSAVEPANLVGQKRILQVGASYQAYIFITEWVALVSGGVFDADYDETLIENVIIQETQPATAKIGDIWIKMSTRQAFKYFWDWNLYAGV